MKNVSNVIKWLLFVALSLVVICLFTSRLIPTRLHSYIVGTILIISISPLVIVGIILIVDIVKLTRRGEKRVTQLIKKEGKRLKQKAGILLIILGIFIPSIFYPFLTVNHKERLINTLAQSQRISYPLTFRALEIVLVEGEYIAKKNVWKGRTALPYPYIVAFGILLVFTGITILALSYKKKDATKMDEHEA